MEPQIVSRPAFTVVGMQYRGKNEQGEIPQLWMRFVPRMHEIQCVVNPHVTYGLCGNMDPQTGEFDYVAGLQVSMVRGVPQGMVGWKVPAQRYAVFACTLPTIGETYRQAYQVWLPQSGYQRAAGPDFELYPEEWDPDAPDSTMYLYIPIK